MDTVALVVNPTSGRGRGARVGRAVRQACYAAGVDVIPAWGTDVESTKARLADAMARRPDAVVAVGGDGLVHLCAQAVAGTDVPLGIVPAGTGNDVARAVGIPIGDVAAGVAAVLGGRIRALDAARVDGRWFLAVMACGFDALVNERANTMGGPGGRSRYVTAMLAELRVFRPLEFTLDLDGVVVTGPMMLVAVGNGPSYGGGMMVCPDAVPDDGLLDITILREVGKAEFVRVFPRVYSGQHVTHPAVETFRARRVSMAALGALAYADGERIGPLPLTVEAVAGAVQLLVPAVG